MTHTLGEQRRALALVLLATLGLAFKGIWAKLAYAQGASVETVLFYRAALSLPLVLLCGHFFAPSKKNNVAPLRLRYTVLGVAMGAFFAICMFCDFQSIYYLGAGVSRVVLFGYPLVVMFLDTLSQRRWPSRARLLGFFAAWTGLLFVCGLLDGHGGTGAGVTLSHLLWGFSSLTLYAIYVFFCGKLSKKMGASRLSTWSNLTTSLVMVGALLIKGAGHAPHITFQAGLWVLGMVLVSTVVPYFLMMEGISRIGATQASLTAMVGPVITLFAVSAILGEQFVWSQIFGVVLTLFGVLVVQVRSPSI